MEHERMMSPTVNGGAGQLVSFVPPQPRPESTQPDSARFYPTQMGARRPPRWNQGCAKGVGITFLLIAGVAIICNIAWIVVLNAEYGSLAPSGVGFWAGGLVLTTGVLMTVSGFRPSRCLIVSVLVMSIITNVFSISFITIGAIQMSMASYPYEYYWRAPLSPQEETAMLGFGGLYLVMGFVCFGLLLAASIMSCCSLCSTPGEAVLNTAYAPQGMVMGHGASAMQPLMQGQPYVQGQPFAKTDGIQMSYGCPTQGGLPPPPPYPGQQHSPYPVQPHAPYPVQQPAPYPVQQYAPYPQTTS